jgi:acetyltransferase-like isoleucine patch superfamily enzyme
MALKDKINANPRVKKLAQWLLQAPYQYRPRWWIRTFVNPLFHKISRKAVIRWSARLDTFPYNRFVVGQYSIIESYTLISNSVGDVILGENVLIGAGSKITGPVNFGNDILLGQNVMMSALNHDYQDVTKPIVKQGFSVKTITVEDGVWIGAGVIITAGVTIGKNAVVGAGSVVTKDVPPFSVVVGNPAKVMKQYDPNSKAWERIVQNKPVNALITEGLRSGKFNN